MSEFQREKPTIVCLCGSTRFGEAFRRANLQETLAGKIVLTIGCDFKSDDALGLTDEDKVRLDELHLRKIDLASEILILNCNGYKEKAMAKYYVYTYAKPDGTVFYVGKGSGYRINVHENMANKGDDSYKSRVIRKIWREGGVVQKSKVFETDDEQEAFEYERMLTRAVGLAYLTNAVEGGGGVAGWRHSDETLALFSKVHRGQKHTAEYKAKMHEFMKEYRKDHPVIWTEEGIKRLAEAARNRVWTEEIHDAHSNGLHRAWDEGRFKGMAGQHHTQEAKDAIAEKLTGRQCSSQMRQKNSEARKQWWNRRRSPENQLTWEKVYELRRLRAEGWTFKALGEQYGITASSAYHIATYKTWKEE